MRGPTERPLTHMKSFLRAAAATGVAAATVVTGLSFGSAAMAAPSENPGSATAASGEITIPAAWQGNGNVWASTKELTNQPVSIWSFEKVPVGLNELKFRPVAGTSWGTLMTTLGHCLRPLRLSGGTTVYMGGNTASEAECERNTESDAAYRWKFHDGFLTSADGSWSVSKEQSGRGGATQLTTNRSEWSRNLGLNATVADIDIERGSARLQDGIAPGDTSSVHVSYQDKSGTTVTQDETVTDGSWSARLQNLALGTTTVHLTALNGTETITETDVDVDLVVPAVKLEQANRYVKDGTTKYAYQVSGGVKGASLQGKAANASNWDTLGTIGADGTAYIADTDKGVTEGDYQLREVFESTPSATTTVAQSAIVKDQLPKVQIASATTFTSGDKDFFSYEIKGVPGAKVQDGPTSGAWADLGAIPASGLLKVYSSQRGPSGSATWDFRQTAGTTVSEKVTLAASDYKPATLGANVVSVDVEAGTAMLDGFAPGNATAVDITYTDKDGKTQSPSAKPADGTWTRTLSNLALGTTRVTLEAFNGSDVIAETTIEVDLPVVPLTATGSFAADNATNATITGTATPNTRVNAFHGESTKPAATTMSNDKGEYTLSVNAPNMAGTYELAVTQEIRGEQTSRQEVELDYGTGVSITSPSGPEDVPEDGMLRIRGGAEKNADVVVTEKGKPETVLGSITAGDNGTYRVEIEGLEEREYTLVVSARSKGNNVTTAELVVNPGKSDVVNPTAEVTFDSDVTKKATVSGTGAKGAAITIKNGTDPIASATVGDDGTWSTQIDPIGPGSHELTIEQTGIEGTQTTSATADFGAAVTANAPTATVDSTLATVTGRGEPGATITLRDDTGTTHTTTTGADGNWSIQGNFRPDTTRVTVTAHSKGALETTVAAELDINVSNRPLVITSPTQDDAKADRITAGKITFTGTATPFSTVELRTWPTIGRIVFTTYADENGNWSATGELAASYYELAGQERAIGGYTDNIRMFAFSTVAFQDTVITSPTAQDVIPGGTDPGVVFAGTATPGATVEIWTWINPRGRLVATAKADGLGNWKTKPGSLAADTTYKLKAEQIALNGKTTVTELGDLQTESFHAVDQIERDQNGSVTDWTLRATPGATVEIWTGPKTATWARKIGSGTADNLGKVAIDGTYLAPGNAYMTKIYQTTPTKEEVTDYNFTTDPA